MIHDEDIEMSELGNPDRIGRYCYRIHSEDEVSVWTDEENWFLEGPEAWSVIDAIEGAEMMEDERQGTELLDEFFNTALS